MDLWALTDLCTPWCAHVVVTLRVADHIAAGHSSLEDIAKLAGAHPESLLVVLRHLVGKGVFLEPTPGTFNMNDAARPLLDDAVKLSLSLDGIGGRMAYAWGTLLSAVRTGKPAYHEAFGLPFWDDLEAHPHVAASFDAMIGPAGHGPSNPNVLPDAANWASIKTVVDVGGGSGSLLAEILRAHPEVEGTLVDLPRTIARSREVFEAAGVMDRVTLAGQSFFDPLPAGKDLYVIKNVLSDWPDPEAIAILKRCAEAARPSSRVVVITNSGPGEAASPDLLMLVLVGGRERSFDDLKAIADTAGLVVNAVGRQASGKVLVEFRTP